MDYSALALKTSQLLSDLFETGSVLPPRSLITASGFINTAPSLNAIAKDVTLNVLLVQDQSASAIMQMTPQFTRDTHIHINYVTLPLEELTTVLSQLHGNHFLYSERIFLSRGRQKDRLHRNMRRNSKYFRHNSLICHRIIYVSIIEFEPPI